ncbi:MAG TPA: hypothetical protein PLO37_14330 [Candidatus Hydrogenedentes bacterium]|nr:hypothetical protein [Candidatus Hydrogenedentota bacterium]HPG68023.1 hypothetical protein [Candidatus Hydrogenedentota bacterium]
MKPACLYGMVCLLVLMLGVAPASQGQESSAAAELPAPTATAESGAALSAEPPADGAGVEPATTTSGRYEKLWKFLNGADRRFSSAVSSMLISPRAYSAGGTVWDLSTGSAAGPRSSFPDFTATKPGALESGTDRLTKVPSAAHDRGTTIFGRPGEGRIIADGSVRLLTEREMTLVNQPGFRMSNIPAGAPASEEAPTLQESKETPNQTGESSSVAEEAEPGSEPAETESSEGGEKPAGNDAAADSVTETVQEMSAAKAQDVERIKELRQAGAWFYNKDNTPLTQRELDDRLASGDVANIKGVDKAQNVWNSRESYEDIETKTTPTE